MSHEGPWSRIPPPLGPRRNPGDAWVEGPGGERYWGRFGAAGLLAVDPERGVLLQHRALWSHHGGTWGLPGGALHEGETPLEGALREASEEAGVPPVNVRPKLTSIVDRDVWSYTTVVADVVLPFEPHAGDAESLELRWIPVEDVASLDLHPGLRTAWPALRPTVGTRLDVIVDTANVLGTRPDGWWRDRRGATHRLLDQIGTWTHAGVSSEDVGLGGSRWFPRAVAVLEGAARGIPTVEGVHTVDASGSADDQIVAEADRRVSAAHVVVVTSDRELSARVRDLGALVRPAGWLVDALAHP